MNSSPVIYLTPLLILLLLVGGCATKNRYPEDGFAEPPPDTRFKEYMVQFPAAFRHNPLDESGKPRRWPLMLFLHGAGERGEDLSMVQVHGPWNKVAELKLPFIIVAPQCAPGVYWSVEGLSALLDELEQKLPIDRDRIYVTGLSMGGFGTWALAASSPDRFAAIAPVCGGGDPANAAKYADLPIWAFHGEADDVVFPEESIRMVDAVNAAGGNARLTVYKAVGHDSWGPAYSDPELYHWMLQHSRSVDQ